NIIPLQGRECYSFRWRPPRDGQRAPQVIDGVVNFGAERCVRIEHDLVPRLVVSHGGNLDQSGPGPANLVSPRPSHDIPPPSVKGLLGLVGSALSSPVD